MRLIDIVTSPWAIVPEKLLEIRAIYETHLRGEKIDIKAVEAQLGRPLANEPKPYQVLDGGIAVVPLVGVMAKRANMFMQISGGVSTRKVANDLAQAINDPQVRAIVMEVDSPGGHVDGVMELAEMVAGARASGKPVVSWISGAGCSAAYWVASAADRVVISEDTTLVGSIGVVATHVDVSRREEVLGIKTTEITAGKYKRIASAHQPLSEEGRQSIQEQVDAIYSVFVDQVAANRGTSAEDVLERMADGRVFIGQAAIAAGLVDGVSTFQALVDELRSRPGVGRRSSTLHGATMNRDLLKADHPEVFEAVRKEGFDAGCEQGLAQGAQAERERIAAIDAHAVVGHEAITAKAKAEGWDAGRYAMEVLAAEKADRAAAAARHAADAPAPVTDAPPADGGNTIKRDQFNALPADKRMALSKAGIKVTD
jgi:signal peptide peptidase SppA